MSPLSDLVRRRGVLMADGAQRLLDAGVQAIGVNCGKNLADSEAALAEMRAAAPQALLVSKANAGIPEWKGAQLSYSGTRVTVTM